MVSLVGEDEPAGYEQRPEPVEALLLGSREVDVEISKGHRLVESGQGVGEVAPVKYARLESAEAPNVGRDLVQRAGVGAALIRRDRVFGHHHMACVDRVRLREALEGVEDMKLAPACRGDN